MDKPRLPLPAEPLPTDCPVATNLANVVQSLPQSLADERRHLVIVTEGIHDIAFLKSISTLLHSSDAQLPDLLRLEKAGRLTFIPTGGGSLCDWVYRLAGLGHREFHLYDREVPPVTEERLRLVAAINRRSGCVARLTGKRPWKITWTGRPFSRQPAPTSKSMTAAIFRVSSLNKWGTCPQVLLGKTCPGVAATGCATASSVV